MTAENVKVETTEESEYNTELLNFLNNNPDLITVSNYAEDHTTVDSGINSEIKNRFPSLNAFNNTFSKIELENYINKSLVVVDQTISPNASNVIKKILLNSKPQKNTRELYLTDINNIIFSKDDSINSFKFKYDSYLKSSMEKHKTDIINPNFGKIPPIGHNTAQNKPIHTISDILLTPIIQFPKVIEYIKLHENRELIEFIMKYVQLFNSFDGDFTDNDKHFYAICLLIAKKNKGIHDDHQTVLYLKEIMENLDSTQFDNIDDFKFEQVLDPFIKFPQVIRLNEFDLKQLFNKLNNNFKNDYAKIETFIKTINSINGNNKLFLEHFLKVSLLLKFIVSQIINITYKFECKNYNQDTKKSEIIEFPDNQEFEILNTLVSKVLGLKDFYKLSNNNQIVSINKNMIFKKNISQNALQVQNGVNKKPLAKGNQNPVSYSVNGFNNSYNPLVDGALDPIFFINWIVPVLNRFFRITYELPNFYRVDKLGIENFNASFKNEHYVTILSLNLYKSLMKDDADFLQKSKVDNVFLVSNSINDDLLNKVTRFFIFNDASIGNKSSKINKENLILWRNHLLNEIKFLQKENNELNDIFENKIENLDVIRYNKIPNLINGKFDNELTLIDADYVERAKRFIENEVTSHHNKEMNTKSLYYKYFQDESSVTNDMNVKTLKMRLEKCYEQVSVLEKRLSELKSNVNFEKKEEDQKQIQDFDTLKDEFKHDEQLLTEQLYELQEKYKDKSNEAFKKATNLTQLKDHLKSREKYLEVLTIEENKVSKNKEKLGKYKTNITIDNYNSLLALLKSKHKAFLENE